MTGRTNRFAIALAILLAVGASTSAHASEFGARAFGMGGAYTGVASDLSALIYNPSGLALNVFEAGLSFGSNNLAAVSTLYEVVQDPSSLVDGDFKDTKLNLSVLSGASVGDYALGLAAAGTLTVSTACGAGIELCADGEFMMEYIAGMGLDLVSLPANLAGVRWGMSLKRLDGRRLEFIRETPSGVAYDTVTRVWDGQGFSATVGGTVKLTEMVTVGVAAQDIVSTVKWTGTEKRRTYNLADDSLIGEDDDVALPVERARLTPTLRVGASVRPPILGLTLAADLSTDGTVRYGVEKTFLLGLVAVRAGQIRAEETTTTLGFGLNLGPIHLDAGIGTSDGFKSIGTIVEGSVRF